MTIGSVIQTSDLAQISSSVVPSSLPGNKVKENTEDVFSPEQNENATGNTDTVTLSRYVQGSEPAPGTTENTQNVSGESEKQSEAADDEGLELRAPNQPTSPSGAALSDEELQEVQELKRRDAEVKAHEQAHLSAAGNLAQGSVNFAYESGPDGNRYAVGGEINIDTSRVAGDPQATLIKAQKIRRAATAPVDPSAQDRSVAAEATRMEAQARTEISQQAREKQNQYIDENTPEVNFFGGQIERNEKNIQDTYKKIQNTNVLEEQKSFVDFFI